MSKKVLTSTSKWICWLIVFTLVVSCFPMKDWAETTTDQNKEQTSPLTEGQDAKRINQEIEKNQPDVQAPPVDPVEKGPVNTQQEENIQVTQNAAGDYTKKVYLDPVQRKDEQNKWQDISTNLEINQKEQTIEPQNAAIDVTFEQKTDEGSYVTVQDDTSKVEYKLEGGEGDQPFTDSTDVVAEHKENQVFYQNVLPSVELRNTVFDQSIKEDIILQKYEGFYKFRFQVATSLEAIINENGSISFKNKEGSTVFSVPKPYMTDSKVDKASGEPQISYDVHYELKKQDNGYQLTLVANKDWLTANDRTYPVYIDPTLTLGASDDTFVSDAYPTTNYDKFWESASGYYSLKVGKYDSSSGTNYSYVKPDISKLQGSIVDSAKFNIYTAHSYSSVATNVWLDRVDGNWSPGSVTWNTKPGSTNIATTSTAKDQMASFDVLNTVKDWVAGTKPNYGFKLHENGNGQSYWKKFYASENSANKPYLAVDYQYPTLSAPTGTVTSNNDGSGYANLSWNTVKGATGYRIKMFNGATYQTFNVGNVTSWSTKGKGIWPTADEIAAGKYQLHSDGKGTELSTYPSEVYSNAGTKYANSRLYYFRVSAIFPGGESDNSEAYTPIMPLNQPKATPFANSTGGDNGYVKLSWDEDPNAAGYKVWIYNGKNYESFDVGNITTWTTQGKGIWPTASEITSGRYLLHSDGKGTELAKDPSAVYKNSGGRYPDNTNYWFRVTAYGSQGESTLSSPAMPKMPGLEASYLGMEDFWASFEVPGGKVNAFNGNFILEKNDFSLGGRGKEIDISRTYNSQDKESGFFGKGWSSSLDVKVKEENNGDVLYIEQDKRIHRFKKVADGYQAPIGIYLTLTKDSNGFYFKDLDQSVTTFRTDGKLEYKKDANGNKTTYSYVNGKITSISDASGRSVSLSYTGEYISKITYEDQIISFAYNNNELTEVKTANGRTYKYGYENGKLKFVYDPLHTESFPSFTEYTYDEDGKLIKVTDALKKVTNITYDTDNRQATVTGPKGNKDVYIYNEDGNPKTYISDSNNLKLTTTYEYDNNNLVEMTAPKDQGVDSSETYTYDKNGNILEEKNAFGTDKYEYNNNNDVVKTIDTENKETTIAYDETNPVSEVDQTAKTASISNYNSFGNLIESSNDLSAATNSLINPSFENSLGNEWSKMTNNDDGSFASISMQASGSFSGEKVLSISPQRKAGLSEGQQSYIAAVQTLDIEPNKTYTLSGLIKGQSLKNATAFFNYRLLNDSGKSAGSGSNRFNKVTGDTKWKERQLTFTTSATAVKVEVYLEVESHTASVSGEALFDNIQLEEGPVSSSFNIVNNSGFEKGDTGWVKSTSSSTEGTTKWAIEPEGFSGNQSISLERTSTSQGAVNIQQDITLNQTTARDITLTGLSKAENVKNSANKTLDQDYSLWAYVTFTDGSTGNYKAMFPIGTHDWSRSAITINAGDVNKTIQKIRIHAIFRGSFTGKAYFDDIRLVEDNRLVKNTYDIENNYLTKIFDEKGRTQEFSYDKYGNIILEKDANGYQKTFEYNKDNELIQTKYPNDTSIINEYDANGNATKKSFKAGSLTQLLQYEYDLNNKLKSYTDRLGMKTLYSYDDNGNLIKTQMPNGQILEWTYDGANRLNNEKHNGNTSFAYEYDKNGNETKLTDSANNMTLTKSYNNRDLIEKIVDSRGSTFNWTYIDGSEKIQDMVYSQNGVANKTSYNYNALNQIINVIDPQNNKYYFDYDENGNIHTYTAPNGSGSTFTYDVTGEVNRLEAGTPTNKVILSDAYKYDKNGNLTDITSYNLDGQVIYTTSYKYDSMNQLLEENRNNKLKAYTYDGFGNRTSVKITEEGKSPTQINATFNEGNQLLTFGNETLSYDKSGNRISDGKYVYKWNALDQLVEIKRKGENSPFAQYKYDNLDRRIEKNINGNITRFFYENDNINPLYETDANGNITRSYVYLDGGDLLSMRENGKTYFYHYNLHGDVVALTDENGNIVVRYSYDAWGNTEKQTINGEPEINNPFTYSGYMQDTETGLYYLNARYYNPTQGVFLSTDPDVTDEETIISQNVYTYVDNNPVMNIDPDGARGFKPAKPLGKGKAPKRKNTKSKPPSISNKTAEKALAKLDKEKNKQNHILKSKHAWKKVVKNPNWKSVRKLMKQTLTNGKEEKYDGSPVVKIRSKKINGQTVQVTFVRNSKNSISVSNGWVKTAKKKK